MTLDESICRLLELARTAPADVFLAAVVAHEQLIQEINHVQSVTAGGFLHFAEDVCDRILRELKNNREA